GPTKACGRLTKLRPGANAGRIDGKVPHGVSPIQEPSLGRRSTLVAVGPVRRARRGNVAVTSVGQTRQSAAATRQSAAATRQSAAATVERRGGVRGFGAGRSGERSFPSPGVHGLRESRCS